MNRILWRVRGGSLLCALVSAALIAGAPRPAGAVDKFAAEFLKIGVGARALGMGGAFVSVADDASAAYWNPAGLVQLENREALGMHSSQFGGVVLHDVLGVVVPLNGGSQRSAIGLTLVRLAVDDIRVTKDAKIGEDGDGTPIIDESKVRKESSSDLALFLSYARGFGDRWGGGINVKLVRQSLVGEGASFGVGADIGLHYAASPRLGFGLRLADITTTRLFWDTGRHETVYPTLALGAHTTQEIAALQGTLTVGVNLDLAFEGQASDQFETGNISGNVLPGVEYWFRRVAAIRAGSDGGNFTAGGGVRYKWLGADYAYFDHDELEATHRVSAQVRF